MAGEGEVPEVVVVLEPVVGGASIADIENSLAVRGGVVGVPHQLQFVLGWGAGWAHTVRP